MITFSTFLAVAFVVRSVTGINPIHIPRQNPTLTTSISGISAPTSTAPAVVDAYQNVLQKCGPSLDSAKETALQEYNEEVISEQSGVANVTNANDAQFLSWAGVHAPALNQAQDVCVGAKNELAKAESTETTSSSSSTASSSPTVSSSPTTLPNPVTSSASETTTASSSPSTSTTPLPGDGLRLNSQPIVVLAGLVGLLVGLE